MLSFMLGHKKLLAQVVGITTLLIALYQLHDHVYDAGYDAAIVKVTAEENSKYEALKQDYERNTQKAIDLLNDEHVAALETAKTKEKVVVKTKLVKEYVDKQIEVPGNCDELVIDIMRLLHDSTNIVIGTST